VIVASNDVFHCCTENGFESTFDSPSSTDDDDHVDAQTPPAGPITQPCGMVHLYLLVLFCCLVWITANSSTCHFADSNLTL